MKVTVEDIGPVQKRLSVEVPARIVSEELDRAYVQLKPEANIKGFRKGKVPRSVLERNYGPQIAKEVTEKLIQESLPNALKEANEDLIFDPQVDSTSILRQDEAFTYSILLDIWPEFDPPQYKGLVLQEPLVEITEEEVQGQLEALRRHYAAVESVKQDRPVKNGDIVLIDYSGKIDGVSVDGLSEENYYVEVGAGHFKIEFEEELLEMTKGSEKAIVVSYPEDAINSKVAGKTVRYEVVLKDIKERILSNLDDNFAKGMGTGFNTIEEVKDRLSKQIESDKRKAVKNNLRQQFLEQLRGQVDFPIPDRLVDAKITQMVDNVAGHLQERGLDLERAGMSEDRLRIKMREDAIAQVKSEMILDKIADAEGITVSNDELKKYSDYVESQSERIGVDKEQLQAAIVQNILPKLRAEKTVDFLMEQTIIKPVSQEMD